MLCQDTPGDTAEGPEEGRRRSPLPTLPVHEAGCPAPVQHTLLPARTPPRTPPLGQRRHLPRLSRAQPRGCAGTGVPPAVSRHGPRGPEPPSFLPGPESRWPGPCGSPPSTHCTERGWRTAGGATHCPPPSGGGSWEQQGLRTGETSLKRGPPHFVLGVTSGALKRGSWGGWGAAGGGAAGLRRTREASQGPAALRPLWRWAQTFGETQRSAGAQVRAWARGGDVGSWLTPLGTRSSANRPHQGPTKGAGPVPLPVPLLRVILQLFQVKF